MKRMIDDVMNMEVSLEQTLTYLRVTAQRAGADELADWLQREIKGYGEEDDLPDYRMWSIRIKGDLQVGGMYILSHQDLTELLPPERIEEATKSPCRDGIGSILKLAKGSSDSGIFRTVYGGQINTVLNAKAGILKTQENVWCANAYGEGSIAQAWEALSKVRQHALDLCLACEKAGVDLPHPLEDEANLPDAPWREKAGPVLREFWEASLKPFLQGASHATGAAVGAGASV